MGADVGSDLSIPAPPLCLSHVLGYYRAIAVMSEVDSVHIDAYCRLRGVTMAPLEFDAIIALRAASNMISNGSTPEQVIEAF